MKRIVSVLTAAAAAALGLCIAPKTYAVPDAPDVELTVENHDRASMKWEDNGADGYTVYKLKDGKYKKLKDFYKLDCTMKNLKADTEYTYAVTAFDKSGESEKTVISFTTPEKWIYTHGNGKKYDDKDYDNSNVYRRHYDGTGLEKFDFFPLIKSEYVKEDGRNAYSVCRVEQDKGHVYIYCYYLYVSDTQQIDCFRFANDGNGGETVYVGDVPEKKLFIDEDNFYFGYSSGTDNSGELPQNTDALIIKSEKNDKGDIDFRRIYTGKNAEISDIISDGKYIYFFASPYMGTVYGYEGEETENTSEEKAYLFRTPVDIPAAEFNDNGYIKDTDATKYTEKKAGFDYPYKDDMLVLGMSEKYIWYIVREKDMSEEDEKSTYGIYKISSKGGEPERCIGLKYNTLSDVILYGGKIYLFGDNTIYSIDTSKKLRPEKLVDIPEDTFRFSLFDYDVYYGMRIKDHPMQVSDGQIIITSEYIKDKDRLVYNIK